MRNRTTAHSRRVVSKVGGLAACNSAVTKPSRRTSDVLSSTSLFSCHLVIAPENLNPLVPGQPTPGNLGSRELYPYRKNGPTNITPV